MAAMCHTVTSIDRPCSHLKRWRKPSLAARLMAGISHCRSDNAVAATGAITAAKTTSCGHYNEIATVAVAITNMQSPGEHPAQDLACVGCR